MKTSVRATQPTFSCRSGTSWASLSTANGQRKLFQRRVQASRGGWPGGSTGTLRGNPAGILALLSSREQWLCRTVSPGLLGFCLEKKSSWAIWRMCVSVQDCFFPNYRSSQHHSALDGKSPQQIQSQTPVRKLPAGFFHPQETAITEGQIHFMRAVSKERQVLILNKKWDVKLAEQDQGVWATLFLSPKSARLRIYDAAPDVSVRRCLVEHPFPLMEPVVPLQNTFKPLAPQQKSWWQIFRNLFQRPIFLPRPRCLEGSFGCLRSTFSRCIDG